LLCLDHLSYAQEEEFEATLSTPVVIDTNTGDLVASENAQLTYGDWLVSADEIRLNRQTNRAIATGNVVFTRGDIRLVADLLDYQVE
jgi:lipopolysaccharide assembly outer membrane protein LptD (OstA)